MLLTVAMATEDADQRTLHRLVRGAAGRHPGNRAVILDDGTSVMSLTYGEMEEAADRVRKMLQHRQGGGGGAGEGEGGGGEGGGEAAGGGEGRRGGPWADSLMVGLYYHASVLLPSCILGEVKAGP